MIPGVREYPAAGIPVLLQVCGAVPGPRSGKLEDVISVRHRSQIVDLARQRSHCERSLNAEAHTASFDAANMHRRDVTGCC
jgi:hypothetical protein